MIIIINFYLLFGKTARWVLIMVIIEKQKQFQTKK